MDTPTRSGKTFQEMRAKARAGKLSGSRPETPAADSGYSPGSTVNASIPTRDMGKEALKDHNRGKKIDTVEPYPYGTRAPTKGKGVHY